MKLLIIGPYPFRNNGISKYIAQYRDELQRQGHRVETEAMYFWPHKWRNFRWLALGRRLNEDFDAIILQHTPTVSGPLAPLFLKAARRRGVMAAVVCHEPPPVYARHLPSWLRPLYHAYERTIAEQAGACIVHTRSHADALRTIGVVRPIRVIPHPVFGAARSISLNARRSCWAYFGMVSPKKGLDLLLEAYQGREPGDYPPLLILGQAAPGHEAYFDQLVRSVGESHRHLVTFMGYVEEEDLGKVLSRVSLMILPYRWVSQSGALAHSCLYRVPFLASDLPYFRDFAERYPCGRLFRSGSAASLGEALDREAREGSVENAVVFDAMLEDLSLSRCTERLLECIAIPHAQRPSRRWSHP